MAESEYCYSVAMAAKRWLDCNGKEILFTSTHTAYCLVSWPNMYLQKINLLSWDFVAVLGSGGEGSYLCISIQS